MRFQFLEKLKATKHVRSCRHYIGLVWWKGEAKFINLIKTFFQFIAFADGNCWSDKIVAATG